MHGGISGAVHSCRNRNKTGVINWALFLACARLVSPFLLALPTLSESLFSSLRKRWICRVLASSSASDTASLIVLLLPRCRFDVLCQVWQREAPLTTKRARSGAAAIGDLLCVVRLESTRIRMPALSALTGDSYFYYLFRMTLTPTTCAIKNTIATHTLSQAHTHLPHT